MKHRCQKSRAPRPATCEEYRMVAWHWAEPAHLQFGLADDAKGLKIKERASRPTIELEGWLGDEPDHAI